MRWVRLTIAASSIVLAAAAGILWVRSYRSTDIAGANGEHVTWLYGGDRYTLRSQAGQLSFAAPPADSSQGDFEGPSGAEAVAKIANTDLEWVVIHCPHGTPSDTVNVYTGGAAEELEKRFQALRNSTLNSRVQFHLELLRALEVPHKAITASFLLGQLSRDYHYPSVTVPRKEQRPLEDETFTVRFGPMNAQLRITGYRGGDSNDDEHYDAVSTVDPSQLPGIRDYWHRKLDVTRHSFRWWIVTATVASPVMLQTIAMAIRIIRRRVRVRTGRCAVCGYDLRANTGKCPECGTATNSKRSLPPPEATLGVNPSAQTRSD